MSRKPALLRWVIAVTTASVLAPPNFCFAAEPKRESNLEARSVQDVARAEGGIFRGQLIDPAGALLPGVPLTLHRNGVEVGSFSTDHHGSFAIGGLAGGAYELVAGSTHHFYRLWSHGTAPPTAVASTEPCTVAMRDVSIARGQSPTPHTGGISRSTVFALGTIGLIMGGVVAIVATDSGS